MQYIIFMYLFLIITTACKTFPQCARKEIWHTTVVSKLPFQIKPPQMNIWRIIKEKGYHEMADAEKCV